MKLEEGRTVAARVIEATGVLWGHWEVAGSIRRQRPECHDVDLVVIPVAKIGYLEELDRKLRARFARVQKLVAGAKIARYSVGEAQVPKHLNTEIPNKGTNESTNQLTRVDFYFAGTHNWGMVLQNRTGSAQHNIDLCVLARRREMEYRVTEGIVGHGSVIMGARTEEEVYAALGLRWIPAELREKNVAFGAEFRLSPEAEEAIGGRREAVGV